MGTRSVIQVVGCMEVYSSTYSNRTYNGSIRLYRHWDGDPDVCLSAIARAVDLIEQSVASSHFWRVKKEKRIAIEPMAQAIVAYSLSCDQLRVRTEMSYQSRPQLVQLGEHYDLEWLYIVDCNQQLVNLYSIKQAIDADYMGEARDHLAAGFFKDAELVFRQEYSEKIVTRVLAEYEKNVGAIKATGWKFNELPDPYLELQHLEAISFSGLVL